MFHSVAIVVALEKTVALRSSTDWIESGGDNQVQTLSVGECLHRVEFDGDCHMADGMASVGATTSNFYGVRY